MDHKTCVKRHIWKFWIWWPFLTWPWPWPGLNMKQFHSSVPLPGPWEYIWKVLGETCYVWGHYGLQPENTRFWPLTWPWPDTWPQFGIFESDLEASRRDLSNAASPVSLRPSVFEIAGGGRIRPPPPPRLWWVQKQPRRWRVKVCADRRTVQPKQVAVKTPSDESSTPDTRAEAFKSCERKNSIRVTNEKFDACTHVNGWKPAVYMSCFSQNFHFLHVPYDISSVFIR